MNIVLAMLLLWTWSLGTDKFNFESQVGVVDTSVDRRLCLSILNPHLSNHTRVNIVLPHKPQRVASAIIEERVTRSCSSNDFADPNASFYWLKQVGKQTIDLSVPLPAAIAIIALRSRSSQGEGLRVVTWMGMEHGNSFVPVQAVKEVI